MSETQKVTPESTPVDALAHENLPSGKIVGVGVASLVIFGIGILASTYELNYVTAQDEAAYGKASVPTEVGKSKVGLVHQNLFTVEHQQKDELKKQQEQLGGYGWVDPKKKVVHIPIEQAMQQVVSEQKK